MINKSSIKVILAFIGVVLLGLISLTVLSTMDQKDKASNTAKVSGSLTK